MPGNVFVRAVETPADVARLRAFVAEQGAEAVRGFDRHLRRPRYHHAFTRIAERAGAVVGYVLIGHERRRLGAATLEIGVIEQIDAQGDQNIFEPLLGDCLGVLLEHGLPLALLYGPTSHYMPFGFAPYYFSAEAELWIGGDDLHDALRSVTENDLDDLAALYEASYHDLPLAEVRVAPDWRIWLANNRGALALEDQRGRVVAYAAIKQHMEWDALHINEAAAADAGAARALCAALLARAQAQGLETIDLALSPWHLVTQAVLQLRGDVWLAVGGGRDDAALAGIVDLPGMLEALVPEFERRLLGSRYARWSGNLRVEVEAERVTLSLDNGRATVIDGSRPADVRLREVSLPGLAQLCLGYRAAADLRATGDLAYDDATLGLIDALFPVVMACGEEGGEMRSAR